jgi:protein SCO1/2
MAALGGIVAATLAKRSGDGDGAVAQVTEVEGIRGPRSPFKGALRKPVPAATFALRNENGRLVQLIRLRGKVVVLAPMYTACQTSCPLVAQQIRAAIDDLPRGDRSEVAALALSVDPAHDTPASARNFIRTRRVGGYLNFLLGSQDELRPVWEAYGFARQLQAREHNSLVVLIDRRGRQRVGFPVGFLTPEGLTHDLLILLRERS